jgi:hypothetical protein
VPRTDALITARRIAVAIIAVVNDTPTGAPADLLFAPLQQWISREQFEQTMRLLVEARRIAQRGDRYFPIRTPNTRPLGGRPGATREPPLPQEKKLPKPTITREERNTLIAAKRISLAVTEAIKECPQGAHAGLLYAVLMPYLSYPQFTALMTFLVKAKLVVRQGDTFFPAPEADARP